jgi:hypothetical protein
MPGELEATLFMVPAAADKVEAHRVSVELMQVPEAEQTQQEIRALMQ